MKCAVEESPLELIKYKYKLVPILVPTPHTLYPPYPEVGSYLLPCSSL